MRNQYGAFFVWTGDGEGSHLFHALVRLLRPGQGAARVARDRVRGDLARRRSRVPAEAVRPHGRLDGSADRRRRAADRRLHGAVAARPRRPLGRAARSLTWLPLAARAVPRAATADTDLVDRRPAPSAGLAFAAVDAEAVLHAAALS